MASGPEDPTFRTSDLEVGSNSSRSSSGRSTISVEREDDPSSVGLQDPEIVRLSSGREEDDVEPWSVLEKLSTYDRLRTGILKLPGMGSKGEVRDPMYEIVDVAAVDPKATQQFVDKIFRTSPEADNDAFLAQIRARMDKVGVQLPTVEVRYENLTLDAKCEIGDRSLPTLYNSLITGVDTILGKASLSFTKTADLNILHNVSGILKPGRMTLLLGPPGCGKTSLLLALAGQLENSVKIRGDMTYNGHTFDEFTSVRTGAYVQQTDLHLAEFTVRETMDYSSQYQGVGSRLDLLTETIRRERELGIHPDLDVDFYMKAMASQDACHEMATDYMLKILGLDVCADTKVGDDMTRGISGGQKKRVTIGEMIVGPARVYYMDEITSGLDSATAFQIITCLGQLTHRLDMTFLIALLQPAPEVFDLFDDVILLAEGQTVYHGPCTEVLAFFESCGFRCPPRKGIADFLQEVTSHKDQEQYWHDKRRRYEYVSVHKFCSLFLNSPVGVKLHEELDTPFDKSKSHKDALVYQEWPLSQKHLFNITFKKELLFLKRNAFIYVFKTVQMMIQALVLMSLFLRTNMHRRNLRDASKFNAALFTTAVTLIFNGYSDLILTVVRLPNFYKLRDMKFVPGWAFALTTFVTRLPFSFTESIAFMAIVYYPVGFAPAGGRFMKSLLAIIISHQMASSLFRALAGICRTIILANSLGSMIFLAIYSLGGFVVSRARLKVWWLWGYWASPLAWTLNAVNQVEFLAPQWNRRLIPGDTKTIGQRQLHLSGLYAHGYWYWTSLGVLLVHIILYNLIFVFALTYVRGPGRPRPVVNAEVLATLGAKRAAEENSEKEDTPSLPVSRSSSMDLDNRSGSRKSTEVTKRSSGIELSRTSSRVSGSFRDRSSLDLVREAAGVTAKRGMVLPFQPLSISFENVNYFVDMPAEMRERGATGDKLQLLRGITGAFRPGILTALVGVTGAGKSTLMDVLFGRKTKGIVEGDIRISGFPKVQETFARVSGYCEQNDIHSPNLTVHESLIFSAWLRLHSDIGDDTKRQFVEEVMELVELQDLAYSIVGSGARSGLSIEQRKRLTIAVELVANPSIIFMDEPTTGLDARAAAIVMRAVRNTVDTGRTVVCTIHQPSIDIFESFDELLLLKQGGQCIYAGSLGRHSAKLVQYFEEIPGIPKIRDGYNPATWMLDITTMGSERKLEVDFAEIYKNSAQYQRTKELVDELKQPPPGSQELCFPDKYSRSYLQQLSCLLWKVNLSYWRLPEYNLLRFVFTLFAGLFFGTLFLHTGQKRGSQFNVAQILGSVVASGLMMGFISSMTVQPVVFIERKVSYRELASRMYSNIPFCIAQLLIEVPYTLAQAILYSTITYSLINLEWKADKFFMYIYFTFTLNITFGYYGMMMMALTPNLELAQILLGFFFNLFTFFSGFLIAKPQIPVWWSWYYWANPIAWVVYGQIVAQFGDLTDKYVPVIGFEEKMTIPHFLKVNYGFRHDWLGYTIAMCAVFPFLFASVYVVSMRIFNYQNR